MEYLSDGLSESILFGLSQLPEIHVLARSAVFRYKGSEQDSMTTTTSHVVTMRQSPMGKRRSNSIRTSFPRVYSLACHTRPAIGWMKQ
jgi:hypothetical protein